MDSTPEVPVRTDEPHSIVAENPASTWDIFKFRISGLDLISEESPPNDVLPHLNLVLPQIPTIPPEREPPVSLTPETAFLLQTYLRTVATWMDLMDHGSTYQLFIPRLTLTSPLLFHSVCAFAAKHLALTDSFQKSGWEPVASYHYGESLRLLIHALNTPSHEHALTATILLSSYEIIAALASEYHRRHLLGQAMLIKEHRITAQSAGIDRANFWIHVRHDISVALATERPLLLDPEDWNVRWQEGETREDLMGNHVLWILARVINLVYGEESRSPTGKRRREAFLRELEEYRLGVSDAFIGIPFGHEDDEGFRKHYFTVTAAGRRASMSGEDSFLTSPSFRGGLVFGNAYIALHRAGPPRRVLQTSHPRPCHAYRQHCCLRVSRFFEGVCDSRFILWYV